MIMAVVYLGLFGLLFLIECYLKKDIEELNVTRRELLVVVIVAAAVFGMSNLSYLDQNGLFSGRFAMDIFIIRTLVDLSGMAVLYAYHIQVKEMQLRLEKDALRNIMEMQYKNYQLSRESIDVVNQKYHDLKHQINLLRSQAEIIWTKWSMRSRSMRRRTRQETGFWMRYLPINPWYVRNGRSN